MVRLVISIHTRIVMRYTLASLALLLSAGMLAAQTQVQDNKDARFDAHPLRLTQNTPAKTDVDTRTAVNKSETTEVRQGGVYGYREVSDFFNIREANPQVDKGEWEFETQGGWATYPKGDDKFGMQQSIKYGITDDLLVELEVLESNLGDGANQGPGSMELVLFNRFVRETDCI